MNRSRHSPSSANADTTPITRRFRLRNRRRLAWRFRESESMVAFLLRTGLEHPTRHIETIPAEQHRVVVLALSNPGEVDPILAGRTALQPDELHVVHRREVRRAAGERAGGE